MYKVSIRAHAPACGLSSNRLKCSKHRRQQSCCSRASAPTATPDAQAVKDGLRELIAPVNRGIFGVKAELQSTIEEECQRLEELNPCTTPLQPLESVAGTWRVLYSSIRILGTKRSKLGLREFVKVGELWQDIDAENHKATNRVEFALSGALREVFCMHAHSRTGERAASVLALACHHMHRRAQVNFAYGTIVFI